MLKKIVKKGVLFILHNLPAKNVKAEISVLDSNELLKNRVAFITGGTSGIGYYIASKFLQAGAKVIICGRTESRVKSACEKIQATVKDNDDIIKGIVLDVKDVSCFNDKIKEAEECFNRHIDILVNNAGVLGGHISDVSEEEYDNILDTNLKGHFFMARDFAKYMIKNGISGNILNIVSSSSFRPANSAYAVSKWGMRGLTEGLARSLAPHGIVVNAIAPGPTTTPMLNLKDDGNIYNSRNLMGRFLIPEEIASVAVLMVSKLSQALIGQVICMTGGSGNIMNEDVDFDF